MGSMSKGYFLIIIFLLGTLSKNTFFCIYIDYNIITGLRKLLTFEYTHLQLLLQAN